MPILTTGAGAYPAAGAAPFTPASLSGLIGWYDASVSASMKHLGATATNGQSVDTWVDQSSAGNDITLGSAAPTLNTTGFNTSFPTVAFDSALSQSLTKTSYAIGTGSTLTAFIVAQMKTGVGNYGRLLCYTKSGAASSFDNAGSAAIFIRNVGNNQINSFANNVTSTSANLALDTPAIFGSIFTGSVFSIYMNGTRAGTGDAFSTAFATGGKMQIGIDDSGAAWNGFVSEVIIATSDNTASATTIYNYLKAKWGL